MAYLGGIRQWPPWHCTPWFFTKNLQAQCMDVWCEAFCCRHIYFRTMIQSASEHAFLFTKLPSKGETPSHTDPLQCLWHLHHHTPLELNHCPFLKSRTRYCKRGVKPYYIMMFGHRLSTNREWKPRGNWLIMFIGKMTIKWCILCMCITEQ